VLQVAAEVERAKSQAMEYELTALRYTHTHTHSLSLSLWCLYSFGSSHLSTRREVLTAMRDEKEKLSKKSAEPGSPFQASYIYFLFFFSFFFFDQNADSKAIIKSAVYVLSISSL
jgi:hypothetical protein